MSQLATAGLLILDFNEKALKELCYNENNERHFIERESWEKENGTFLSEKVLDEVTTCN